MKVDGLCRHLRYGSTTSEHVSRSTSTGTRTSASALAALLEFVRVRFDASYWTAFVYI